MSYNSELIYTNRSLLTGVAYSLAYSEMRMILARVLWNFDLELQPESENWVTDNRTYTLWEKGDLKVKLIPVVR